MATVCRPVTLHELIALVETPHYSNNIETLRDVVGLCGSFMTIREDTVYFIHQSAKEFLIKKAYNIIFPSGINYSHYMIFAKSIAAMQKTLCHDIYGTARLAYTIDQVKAPSPNPLASMGYSCVSGYVIYAP